MAETSLPLFEACKNGDLDKVKVHLIPHDNVNSRDTAGRRSTPLHFAAGELHRVVASAGYENGLLPLKLPGFSVSKRPVRPRSIPGRPRGLAGNLRQTLANPLFLSSSRSWIGFGRKEVVEYLIRNGARVDIQDDGEWAILRDV